MVKKVKEDLLVKVDHLDPQDLLVKVLVMMLLP